MDASVISVFASIAFIQVLGWLTPGANLVAVSSASMSAGRLVGVFTALGLSGGIFVWATAAVFGIALFFQTFPSLFLAMKLAGAMFLLWLGWQSILAARAIGTDPTEAQRTSPELGKALRTGFLVLMANPKAPIFFGAILTSFLPLDATAWIYAGIVIQFTVLSAILNSITALVFSTPAVVGWFERNRPKILFVFGLLYLALALLVVRDALWNVAVS